MQHFTHFGQHTAPKNKLQKKAIEFLRSESHRLIDSPKIYIESLAREIVRLNVENPRCSPLKFSTYKSHDSIGVTLGGQITVAFHIYPVKTPKLGGEGETVC